jgi:hypothetical protein
LYSYQQKLLTLLFLDMAGTFVVAPNGFEIVGDSPPTVQHWLTLSVLSARPAAHMMLMRTQKTKEIESGKKFSTSRLLGDIRFL